jgi:hypothetical protein
VAKAKTKNAKPAGKASGKAPGRRRLTPVQKAGWQFAEDFSAGKTPEEASRRLLKRFGAATALAGLILGHGIILAVALVSAREDLQRSRGRERTRLRKRVAVLQAALARWAEKYGPVLCPAVPARRPGKAG